MKQSGRWAAEKKRHYSRESSAKYRLKQKQIRTSSKQEEKRKRCARERKARYRLEQKRKKEERKRLVRESKERYLLKQEQLPRHERAKDSRSSAPPMHYKPGANSADDFCEWIWSLVSRQEKSFDNSIDIKSCETKPPPRGSVFSHCVHNASDNCMRTRIR